MCRGTICPSLDLSFSTWTVLEGEPSMSSDPPNLPFWELGMVTP